MKTKYFTGNGDKGVVSVGNNSYKKDAPFFELLGTVDYCNSEIGVARAYCKLTEVSAWLVDLQQTMFVLQAELAAPYFGFAPKTRIEKKHIEHLESIIHEIDSKLPKLESFVLPGGTVVAAHCDVARTVARNCERIAVSLQVELSLSEELLAYLNRLSSVLFAVARYANFADKVPEITPTY